MEFQIQLPDDRWKYLYVMGDVSDALKLFRGLREVQVMRPPLPLPVTAQTGEEESEESEEDDEGDVDEDGGSDDDADSASNSSEV